MNDWHGYGPVLNISQLYETTIIDSKSNLSAHFVVAPARSLGGRSYLFPGAGGLFHELGLFRLADIPLGGVARSLAACLISENIDEFMRRFDAGFEEEIRQPSITPREHFGFAEYLTFARVIPFEWSPLSTESLGHIVAASGRGKSGYVYYEDKRVPMLIVAIPAGMVICGSAAGVTGALEAGLRDRLIGFAKSRTSERQERDASR
jgi:hypothetical protein